ncbi:hypothetical protein [Paenibacillus sp. BC26]|uniref:hypothetical protein n=1 Tax=Paenibacillus sp. BC26 TaxID=1881032 RepID=UPI0008E573F8|nr:hypothetical protein [Paenibacillus sp. BC26]SFT05614.1 hypothetical protein SAMN05428962_4031 [Paenibacillus sp. BC26]
MKQLPDVQVAAEQMSFCWKTDKDQAVLERDGRIVWQGSLLPSFELADETGLTSYTDAIASNVSAFSDSSYQIALEFGEFGRGSLQVIAEAWGIRFAGLEVVWHRPASIVALYFGTKLMTDMQRRAAPSLTKPFWPNWKAEGYCLPCAGSNPTRSFWRFFDMGDALLPLGSFGDAMGTSYAAAYPRPLYAAAMGGGDGWMSFGPGEIPDAALSLQLKSATACMQYLYREDLWKAPDLLNRSWSEPLRLAWGANGFDAYDRLYQTFPVNAPKSSIHAKSFVCTWGDFKEGQFNLRAITERISRSAPADMIVLDEYWETCDSSGIPDYNRFPEFDRDLAHMQEEGFEIAVWQSIGWIDRPEEFGLTDKDLLCGADGKPRLWRWSGDPIYGQSYHYCLDPSSERTRSFLTERTRSIVSRLNPVALKLDFGYGLPGPDVSVPRRPEFRGERLCTELLKIITDAAKEAKPDITIIYYGLHPLLHDYFDVINIDDLGDAGDSAEYEALGHNQRCMWSALAARRGMLINASTGYYWDTLERILLNTAVVGTNGLTLGATDRTGKAMTASQRLRWLALEKWRRSGSGWTPLWLDADFGDVSREPAIRSWGRVESHAGPDRITALALRHASGDEKVFPQVSGIRFKGDWALIAQDDKDILHCSELACIPFAPGTLTIEGAFEAVIEFRHTSEGETTKVSTSDDSGKVTLCMSEMDLNEIVGVLLIRK